MGLGLTCPSLRSEYFWKPFFYGARTPQDNFPSKTLTGIIHNHLEPIEEDKTVISVWIQQDLLFSCNESVSLLFTNGSCSFKTKAALVFKFFSSKRRYLKFSPVQAWSSSDEAAKDEANIRITAPLKYIYLTISITITVFIRDPNLYHALTILYTKAFNSFNTFVMGWNENSK